MTPMLTKADVIDYIQCPIKGLTRKDHETEALSEYEALVIEQGNQFGALVRKHLFNGTDFNTLNLKEALFATNDACSNRNGATCILYEAAFIGDDVVARPDVIIIDDDGVDIYEAKATTNPKKVNLADLAVTARAVSAAGHTIRSIHLVTINKVWDIRQEGKHLLDTADVTEAVTEIMPLVDEAVKGLLRAQAGTPTLTRLCKTCANQSVCYPSMTKDSVFLVPRISDKALAACQDQKVYNFLDITDAIPLTVKQQAAVQALKGYRSISKGLPDALKIDEPVAYLDFETVTGALPFLPGVRPYEQALTQWSIHHYDRESNLLTHTQYLADPATYDTDVLARQLIADIGNAKSIVVYSDFERRIIEGLAKKAPQYADELHALVERLVDFERIVKDHVHDPAFRGRSSIKVVLPALCPELSYDGMAVADGAAAIVAFTSLANAPLTDSERAEIKDDLLKYCQLDTLAMVALHDAMEKLAGIHCENRVQKQKEAPQTVVS